jgi:hypothetical protein
MRELEWVGSALRDLKEFPCEVKQKIDLIKNRLLAVKQKER